MMCLNMTNIMKKMSNICSSDKKQMRENITMLEQLMLKQEQAEIEPTHVVHGGMYARAVTVKKDTLLTGSIYLFDHIEIMASGKIIVTTDDDSSQLLTGFNIMPAMSGKKRAAYALEDTTWITVHNTSAVNGEDGEEIQDQLTVNTFEDLEKFYNDVNRADYKNFIDSQNWKEETLREIIEDEKDLDFSIDLKDFGLELKDSDIQGKGLFATRRIEMGACFMPARINGKRTQAGRYINHAVRPNCEFIFDGVNMNCVALQSISAGEEITVNYRHVMQIRDFEGDLLCQE